MMRILGLSHTGFAAIDVDTCQHIRLVKSADALACNVMKVDENWPTYQRLSHLYAQLRKLITLYHPDVAVIETVFTDENPQTALYVGQIRGVFILALAQLNVPVAEYPPQLVSESITGERDASQGLVGAGVRKLLSLPDIPFSHDALNGAALALCHYRRCISDLCPIIPSQRRRTK